jgi:fatty-acyl-CoA synthase
MNDCGTRLVVFHDSFLGSIDPIRRELRVDKDKFLCLRSADTRLPGCPDWAEEYEALVRNEASTEPIPESPVAFDDPLSIIYTSGVTGRPKGAVLSHRQTYFKSFQVGMYTGAGTDDVVVAQMPLFHSGGLFIVATPALCSGMTMVMRRGFDPDEFAADIERYRGTIVFALTTMWRRILETGRLDRTDVSSVRCVVGGGERTPPSVVDELAKRGLYMQQGFGQTENSAMMMLPKEDIFRKRGSIGKPGFFTNVWIAGPNGKSVPPGEIGEIVASGPTVMTGYWNLPGVTAKTIVDGVLHTGDLGYMDEEGYFYIVDRVKDMYRSGGENVYPADVEKILLTHPKILNAAIVGVPDERWGETGMAFIVAKKAEALTKEEIYCHLDGKVARFKYPQHIELVDELPLTATMKVRKQELRQRYARS